MQSKVARLQEQYEAAVANSASATEEVEELRGAISSMDVRLGEFQRKDAEVYSRIKEAMEQAEEAKLGREALEGRELLLLKEVKMLLDAGALSLFPSYPPPPSPSLSISLSIYLPLPLSPSLALPPSLALSQLQMRSLRLLL